MREPEVDVESVAEPAVAALPARSPLAPAPGEPVPSHYRWCVACGEGHPTGLHVEVTAGDGLTVTGRFTVTEHHQGAPGLAHGGIIATAVDEIVGSLNWLLDGPAVTGRLEVDYRRPVPIHRVLHVEARVDAVRGRRVLTSAVGRLDGADGPVAVTANAVLVRVPLQHFADHGDPAAIQRAIDDRAAGGPSWRPAGEEHHVEFNP